MIITIYRIACASLLVSVAYGQSELVSSMLALSTGVKQSAGTLTIALKPAETSNVLTKKPVPPLPPMPTGTKSALRQMTAPLPVMQIKQSPPQKAVGQSKLSPQLSPLPQTQQSPRLSPLGQAQPSPRLHSLSQLAQISPRISPRLTDPSGITEFALLDVVTKTKEIKHIILSYWKDRVWLSINQNSQEIHGLAYSPDGLFLLIATGGSEVTIENAQTFKQIAVLSHTPDDRIDCVAFSPDGKYIITGATDGALIIWDGTWCTKFPRKTPAPAVVSRAYLGSCQGANRDVCEKFKPKQTLFCLSDTRLLFMPLGHRSAVLPLFDLATRKFEDKMLAVPEGANKLMTAPNSEHLFILSGFNFPDLRTEIKKFINIMSHLRDGSRVSCTGDDQLLAYMPQKQNQSIKGELPKSKTARLVEITKQIYALSRSPWGLLAVGTEDGCFVLTPVEALAYDDAEKASIKVEKINPKNLKFLLAEPS